ncbi:MAG: ABC transporter ATP-binding protein [Candidatus Omnitrophica bacterium]|nr:ABC transporter ATP-binding protein [Candidatus Omnitrophota bacterium]
MAIFFELYQLLRYKRFALLTTAFLIGVQSVWTVVVVGAIGIFFSNFFSTSNGGVHPAFFDTWIKFFDHISRGDKVIMSGMLASLSFVLDKAILFLTNFWILKLGMTLVHELRAKVFASLLTTHMSYFDRTKKGYLIQMVAVEIQSCQGLILNSFYFVVTWTCILVSVVLLFLISWQMSMVAMALGILASLIVVRMARWSRSAAEQNAAINRKLMSCTEETLSGIRQIKLLGYGEKLNSLFLDISSNLNSTIRNISLFNDARNLVASILGVLILISVFYVGSQRLLIAGVVFPPFFYLFYRLIGYSQNCVRVVSEITQDAPKAMKVIEYLKKHEVIGETNGTVIRKKLMEREIRFEDVHFGYTPLKRVIRKLNFSISKGQVAAFVGHSGAGKSTVANLLVRLYDITEGRILMDGVNIKDLDLSFLRSKIGVILQEPILFNLSIRENLRMAKPDASDQEIIEASRKAFAHDFIEKLPHGYDHLVGDRGIKLSYGQRQRINIAQIFLKDPEILILDEATSALDSEAEKYILESLAVLSEKKTVIAIAHRLSTIRRADKIFVLKEGEIIEQGGWDQLLSKAEEFSHMVAMQSFN